MAIARVAHVEVAALDALGAPALLRRVLAGDGGLARGVALRVVAAVALLARHRVARVTVPVALAPVAVQWYTLGSCSPFNFKTTLIRKNKNGPIMTIAELEIEKIL